MGAHSTDDLLAAARMGDRTATERLWRAIASGEASDTIAARWVRDVATLVVAKLLDQEEVEANRRREHAMTVLGLEGRRDALADAKDFVAAFPDEKEEAIAHVLDLFATVKEGQSEKGKVRTVRRLRKLMPKK